MNQPKFLKVTSCVNMKRCSTEVNGGGGLDELVKLAREPVPTSPKPCVSLKTARRIVPVRRSLMPPLGRKPAVVRDQLSPEKPSGSHLL